jgi:hypothetical protein
MSEAPSFVGTKFDIFAPKPVQSGVEQTIDTIYKPVASVDQSDLQFVIPGDPDTYLDLEIKLYVKGKLVKADGSGHWTTQISRREQIISSILYSVSAALF